MRIGLFSDLHGNQYTLRAFLDRLPALGLDELVFCGDVFGYYYGQAEILDALHSLPRLHWLLGNHDQYFLDLCDGRRPLDDLTRRYGSSYRRAAAAISPRQLARLRDLSPRRELTFAGTRIIAAHGTVCDPLEGRLYPKDLEAGTGQLLAADSADVYAMGHTHFRMAAGADGALFVNPGSLGQPRDGSLAGFAVLQLPQRQVQFVDVPYDRRPLVADIRQNDPGNTGLIEILFRDGAPYE